ncbi:UNVERIFIED_CONTAM: hypothetical protein Sradi_2031300 [Sesamum radiatum]|uniref:Uncharacterized protein n=1 Tax=Sesamum radiatum TaxID=300843 RepID=A0AAW2TH99_SESRA
MEDAQAAKIESRGEKQKETKEEGPSKKPCVDMRDKMPPFQRVNDVYTPLTIPITQALMTIEGKEGDKAKKVKISSPEIFLKKRTSNLGRPTLNTFQAVISSYYMKIKFPTLGGVGEVQGDPLQSCKCYIEAVSKGQKRTSDEAPRGLPLVNEGTTWS